ncbi:MAG: thiol oxidoreductase [Planctomycetes bacterium]|nr:thiol oxidoreductase [Planctomycetota bacterium]
MKHYTSVWYLVVGLAIFFPLGWRILSFEQPVGVAPEADAVARGKTLFTHEWTDNDPLTKGDGLGPVYNATSCAACHRSPALGGAGGLEHNVTNFVAGRGGLPTIRQGVLHALATRPEFEETLSQVHSAMPPISRVPLKSLLQGQGGNNESLNIPPGVLLSQRNTPALFGARQIDEIPDRVIIGQERLARTRWGMIGSGTETSPVGRSLRLAGGRVGRFGWKAQSASLLEFVQAACANELGLSNPGNPQPAPLSKPSYQQVGLDLTLEQCRDMRDFVAALPRPVQQLPQTVHAQTNVMHGQRLFNQIGCADCHVPNMGEVTGIYSDLLLHRMGRDLTGVGAYYGSPVETAPSSGDGPLPDEWRTPPLWGVAESAPYLHDGRAATLKDAIIMHGGQGQASVRRFSLLTVPNQQAIIRFLESLRAPSE